MTPCQRAPVSFGASVLVLLFIWMCAGYGLAAPLPAGAPPSAATDGGFPADLTEPPAGLSPLSLEQALATGLSLNPRMKAAAELVVKARATYDELRSNKNPQFNLSTRTIVQPETSVDSNLLFPGQQPPPGFPNRLVLVEHLQNQIQAYLQLLLTTFGRIENQIAAALVQIGAAAQNAATERRQLVLNVKQEYFARVRAEASLRVSDLNLVSSKQTLNDTQERFKHGLLARYDVLQAELDVTDATQRVDTARTELANSEIRLRSVLFTPPADRLWAVEPQAIVFDEQTPIASMKTLALARRPELLSLEINLTAARRLLAAARADNNPTMSLQFNYNTNTGNNLMPVDQTSAMLTLQWPIFDGGQRNARVRAAASDLRTLEASVALQRQQIAQQVEESWQKLLLARTNLATANRRLDIATEFHYMARQRFIHGVGFTLEMQYALRNLNEARLAVVVATNDLDLAFANFEQSLGIDFPDRHVTLPPIPIEPQTKGGAPR